MKHTLTLVLCAGLAQAAFGPSVRVDAENRPGWACYHAAIALGRADSGPAPIYVVFENDSAPFLIERSDIAFQRSLDGGRTWLAENILVCRGSRFACYPDLRVARDGTIHLVFTDRLDGSNGNIRATRSTDGGLTWSEPVQIDDNRGRVTVGWARLALDSADNLFCAWTDKRGQYLRVYSDVSTDGGRSWGTDVRVDDDTVGFNCYPPDVYVQPGSNDYLVVAVAPVRHPGGNIVLHSHFYRSTNAGHSFTPGFQLDTFSRFSQQPHVVADAGHIITDYSGNGPSNQCVTMARTYFEAGDSWGPQVLHTNLDTLYSSYSNGGKMAIDPAGAVHTVLMLCDRVSYIYDIYYIRSTDHGLSWSERELVNDAVEADQWDPDIATDDAGFAYAVWQDMRNSRAEIWFATNAWTGLAETRRFELPRLRCLPNPTRGWLTVFLPRNTSHIAVCDAAGRLVLTRPLDPTTTRRPAVDIDLHHLPAGVYLLRSPGLGSARVTLLR